MVGLVDIAPAVETVTVRGQQVEVFGVSAAGVASLLARFPELRRVFAGRDVPVEQLMAMGGDIVNAILAAGTGDPGDPVAEEAAGRLSIDEQVDLVAAIARATLPKGVGPFVEKLTALGVAVGVQDAGAPSPTAPATSSPPSSKA